MDILLYRPEDPSNLGSIIRTSVSFGLERLYIYDSFGILDDKSKVKRIDGVCRRERRAKMDLVRLSDPAELLNSYENAYATVVSRKSRKLGYDRFGVDFTGDPLIIFGNEREGIPRDISRRKNVERIVIPITDVDECLSLPVAYGIVLFEYLRQKKSLPTIQRR